MTDQEKAAHAAELKAQMERAEKAEREAATARAESATAEARANAAEQRSEKTEALNERLQEETRTLGDSLAKETARANAAEEALTKFEIDARAGKKFAPAEREAIDKLVKKAGIETVKELLDARPDLAVTLPILIDGKELRTSQVAMPPEADGSGVGAPDPILMAAQKAADDAARAVRATAGAQ